MNAISDAAVGLLEGTVKNGKTVTLMAIALFVVFWPDLGGSQAIVGDDGALTEFGQYLIALFAGAQITQRQAIRKVHDAELEIVETEETE